LRLGEDEFWHLTLKEFNALSERHKDAQDWLDYRTGLLCSVLAEINRDHKRKSQPYTPADFMPKKASRGQTPEQILATVQMLNAAFGGSVVEN